MFLTIATAKHMQGKKAYNVYIYGISRSLMLSFFQDNVEDHGDADDGGEGVDGNHIGVGNHTQQTAA